MPGASVEAFGNDGELTLDADSVEVLTIHYEVIDGKRPSLLLRLRQRISKTVIEVRLDHVQVHNLPIFDKTNALLLINRRQRQIEGEPFQFATRLADGDVVTFATAKAATVRKSS